jgi:hypothetical protein
MASTPPAMKRASGRTSRKRGSELNRRGRVRSIVEKPTRDGCFSNKNRLRCWISPSVNGDSILEKSGAAPIKGVNLKDSERLVCSRK